MAKAPDSHWADPPAKPIRYRLGAWFADVYHGRRDGRKRIPHVSIAPDGSEPQTAGIDSSDGLGPDSPPPAGEHPPLGNGAAPGVAPQTGPPVSAGAGGDPADIHARTPHLMKLRALARELIGQERVAMLTDMVPIHAELSRLRAQETDLQGRLAAAKRTVEELLGAPPSDEDLKERRIAEADVGRRPDRLVRERRLAEYGRRCGEAEAGYLAVAAELARVSQDIRAHEKALARRLEIARTRAHRVYEHTWRRVATYWQQLVRSHRYGRELNASLRLVGPELPRWAQEPEDSPAGDAAPADGEQEPTAGRTGPAGMPPAWRRQATAGPGS
jgi:hypothetical protein